MRAEWARSVGENVKTEAPKIFCRKLLLAFIIFYLSDFNLSLDTVPLQKLAKAHALALYSCFRGFCWEMLD